MEPFELVIRRAAWRIAGDTPTTTSDALRFRRRYRIAALSYYVTAALCALIWIPLLLVQSWMAAFLALITGLCSIGGLHAWRDGNEMFWRFARYAR